MADEGNNKTKLQQPARTSKTQDYSLLLGVSQRYFEVRNPAAAATSGTAAAEGTNGGYSHSRFAPLMVEGPSVFHIGLPVCF